MVDEGRNPRPRPPRGARSGAQVILCGPYPVASSIGGYERCNDLIASSFLDDRFGIQRLQVANPTAGGRGARLLRDLAAARRCLDACPAPIFHMTAQYQTGTYREYALYRLARRRGRDLLLDIRAGCFVSCYERAGAVAQRALWNRMIAGAAAITVEGPSDAEWLRQRFGRSATWLPNFVSKRDAERIPVAALEQPAPGEPLRLVYVGRLVAEKGLEELIDACRLLEDRGHAVELRLVGHGPADYEARLRERIASRLAPGRARLLGFLDHAEVLRCLADQHVFVFPTRWRGEGHSNAVNEAMQVGLPVVSTRQGFLGSVVTPECGALLDDTRPERIADTLVELTRGWDALRARGEAARRHVYAEFSDETVLARLAEIYDALLARRGSGPAEGA